MTDAEWAAAHARLANAKAVYLRRTDGKLWGKPSTLNGIESKYLLTGFGACGLCGGSLTARVKTHRGQPPKWYYYCLTNIQRGRTVCANDRGIPLPAADTATVNAVIAGVLHADVIAAAIAEAARRLAPTEARQAEQAAEARAQLADLDARRDRFIAAIGDGTGAPEALTAALRETERQRAAITARLAEVATLAQAAALDSPALRRRLGSIVSTWRAALQKNIPSARQILRKLLVDRLRFMPAGESAFLFEGAGRVDPLLVGTLLVPPLSKALVPPG